ncbi:hypothetical protein T02_394 [Trichinella nativa]|uniref:Uncharacterized protein n=1 Tax=Trichinella nativa TaxID=6335 RepID=A0A0V1KWF1_9BILA|nr:hypothetical protein T02_276 [Trichinella nativa]KRZ51102.1 hypothetical protein T02_394 [Trichinella nativa]
MENPCILSCVIGVSSMTTSVANANGSSALRELPSRNLKRPKTFACGLVSQRSHTAFFQFF